MLSRLITYFLEKVQNEADTAVAAGGFTTKRETETLPVPITANAYEHSVRYQNHTCAPLCRGFSADEAPQEHITDIFRRGYTAWKQGDSIEFTVEGSCIAVQYRKSVTKPTPIAKITVDGSHELLLDGNFKETWGDCLYLDTVAEGLEHKIHAVTVEITETHENDAVPFYLVSVIGS